MGEGDTRRVNSYRYGKHGLASEGEGGGHVERESVQEVLAKQGWAESSCTLPCLAAQLNANPRPYHAPSPSRNR